jgi:hypothetical protein
LPGTQNQAFLPKAFRTRLSEQGFPNKAFRTRLPEQGFLTKALAGISTAGGNAC